MFSASDIDQLLAIAKAVDAGARLGGLLMDSPRRSVRPDTDSALTLRLASDAASSALATDRAYNDQHAWVVYIVQPYRTDMDALERLAIDAAARVAAGAREGIGDWTLASWEYAPPARVDQTDQWIQAMVTLRFSR